MNYSKKNQEEKAYSKDDWIYVPDYYCEHREVLGTIGSNPLIVIGVNPSTAEPNNLDPTLKSVERIATSNGYDSFMMFNLYPQRATNPNDMDLTCNAVYRDLNNATFENYIKGIQHPIVWCSWGNLIDKRYYLKECLNDLVKIGNRYNVTWMCAGPISKRGNPHHPLYLKSNEQLQPFDMEAYEKILI